MHERFKELREQRNWTQQQLADQLDISRTVYAAYEMGKAAWPAAVLIKLAEIYHTSIDFLLARTDDPSPYE